MSTITVPKEDVTSEQVTDVLRTGLDPRYTVQPGMRMPRSPLFGSPQPDRPDLILVSSSPMVRAQVTIIHQPGQTNIHVTPAGVLGDLLVNTLGIARTVHRVLSDAPGLR